MKTAKYTAAAFAVMLALGACGRRESRTSRRENAAPAPAETDMAGLVAMKTADVSFDAETQGFVVKMEAAGGRMAGAVVPIVMGQREAEVLRMKTARQSTPRPLTHDLTVNIISGLGASLRYVVVEELREGTFLARIHLEDRNGRRISLDSRASDAIILGVATGVKIYFAEQLVREAGIFKQQDSGGGRTEI